MSPKSKTAEAPTSTVSTAARQGGSMSKSMQELTMQTDITPAPGAAIHIVHVDESRQRPLNPGEPIKFDTTLDGQPVVTRSTTPFFDSCRVLATWGMTGKVEFVDVSTGKPRMRMLITAGAKMTVKESPNGPQVRKLDAESLGKATASGSNAEAVTTEAVEA